MSKCPQDLAGSKLFSLKTFLPNNLVESACLTVIHHDENAFAMSEVLVILENGWTFDRGNKRSGFVINRFLFL